MRTFILSIIDFFYPLFQRLMPLQTFRYAACGGFNTALDIVIFFVSYNYIFKKQIVHAMGFAISPHIASFLAAFVVTFPIGFYFSRYVVFTSSNLRGRVQLVRYLMLVMASIALNYMFIKFFVEQLGIYPTIAKMITTVIVVTFSYLTQKHFTFRTKKIKIKIEG